MTDDEPIVGDLVQGTMNGINWFEGTLVKISDIFAPWGIRVDDEVRYFAGIRKVLEDD
jgi:hypothetical protein